MNKEKALHDLNVIKMTMKMQNTKEEYEAMVDNFDSVEQFITQPIATNEEVETIKAEIIKNTGCVIGNVSTQELQENARKNLTMLIQALTTPKISDSEVEELLESIYLRAIEDRDKPYQKPLMKKYNKLKTKFQQMQQEIEKESKNADYWCALEIKLSLKLDKIEQLLDKIEIWTSTNGTHYYINNPCHREITKNLYNILKELKSIGGNK